MIKAEKIFGSQNKHAIMSALIIDKQNAYFFPRSLLFFGRPTSSYFFFFFYFARRVSRCLAGGQTPKTRCTHRGHVGFRPRWNTALRTPASESTHKPYARASRDEFRDGVCRF